MKLYIIAKDNLDDLTHKGYKVEADDLFHALVQFQEKCPDVHFVCMYRLDLPNTQATLGSVDVSDSFPEVGVI